MSLANELKGLRPGDAYQIGRQQGPLRIVGLSGTAAAPIILGGAIVTGDDSSPYAVRLQECSHAILRNWQIAEAWGSEARGLQLWDGSDLLVEDLRTSAVALDHLHVLAERVTVRRHRGDGKGGRAGRGGAIGAHIAYFTTLDDGDDLSDLVYEDGEGLNAQGACYQFNGDNHTLRNIRLSRCRAIDFGVGGGCAINLESVEGCLVEDLIAQSRFKTDGIRMVDSSGVQLARYSIAVPGRPWLGSVTATAGTPEAPRFDAAPAPTPQPPAPAPPSAPPPGADLAAENAALRARVAELEGWQRRVRDVVGAG